MLCQKIHFIANTNSFMNFLRGSLVSEVQMEAERMRLLKKRLIERRLATAYLKLQKKEKERMVEYQQFTPRRLYWERRVAFLRRSLNDCNEIDNKRIDSAISFGAN